MLSFDVLEKILLWIFRNIVPDLNLGGRKPIRKVDEILNLKGLKIFDTDKYRSVHHRIHILTSVRLLKLTPGLLTEHCLKSKIKYLI